MNRFGERKGNDASEITVVYRTTYRPTTTKGWKKRIRRRNILKEGCPLRKEKSVCSARHQNARATGKARWQRQFRALEGPPATERIAAFSPPPELRIATEIQFMLVLTFHP